MAARKRTRATAGPRATSDAGVTGATGATGATGVAWAWAVVANLVIFTVYLAYARLAESSPGAYYRAVQEDEPLEWATFWAFALAAAFFARAAWRRRHRWPSLLQGTAFLGLLALFCFFVAGEEISWGQRLLGFRPPEYFLAENYQQELNLHNLLAGDLRKLGLRLAILGYGVVLPVLTLLSAGLRDRLRRLGVVAPSWKLIPAFVGMERIYAAYPIRFTGEVVETMLGLGMLIAALALAFGPEPDEAADAAGGEPPATSRGRVTAVGWVAAVPVAAAVAVFLLGAATAAASQALLAADPGRIAQARAEADALRDDFRALGAAQGQPSVSRCNTSQRVYTFMQLKRQPALLEGSFGDLQAKWLAEDRAAFFLDPWSSPWWIRDRCHEGARLRRTFVYSFGPNKRRDSSYWEIRGDDVGAVVLEIGDLPAWLAGEEDAEE